MGTLGGQVKHGHSFKGRTTSTYRIWQAMRDRCNNANCRQFYNYGGRGITVCERWGRFANFIADMGERPDSMELDRIDNDGNYEPVNCRWVTRVQNQNNKRTNRRLTHNGETLTASEWSRRIGCRVHSLLQRIARGMSVEDAITEPFDDLVGVRRKRNAYVKIAHAGETLTCWQWHERTGIGATTIQERIKAGWTPERALTTPPRKLTRKAA